MSLRTDNRQLIEILQDFHTLTGIKIAIFDDNRREILNYPAGHCDLCKIIRSDAGRDACCENSNRQSFDECKQRGRLIIYKCHAGLIEVTAPIKSNGVIIGYFMFGQITDRKNKDELSEVVHSHLGLAETAADCWPEAIRKVKYKSFHQITAAARILEALTYYILQKELVALGHERLVDQINSYVEQNLNREITAATLATHFHISRTSLYELASRDLGMGIASFVRQKRLEKARDLLTGSTASVSEIASQAGFDDPTYFAKVFKRELQLSPSEFRTKYSR